MTRRPGHRREPGGRLVQAARRKRIGSLTLIADARYSWLDAISSLGALAGLALVAGYRWATRVAGLAITVLISHIGHQVTGT